MNWRRGLFRLWIVGSVLFVLVVAFVSYSQIKEPHEVETIATDAGLADWVHQRFYSDMPREQFDKKIAAPKPITEPEVIARLEAIIAKIDTSRGFDEWTDDELRAYQVHRIIEPDRIKGPTFWAIFGRWAIIRASIALGIPLAVLALGSSLVWAFSGFAAKRT
jgi:hypothetical protein